MALKSSVTRTAYLWFQSREDCIHECSSREFVTLTRLSAAPNELLKLSFPENSSKIYNNPHYCSERDSTKARKLFKEHLGALGYKFEENNKNKAKPTAKPHVEPIGNYSRVYAEDIEAGIAYTLKQEVILKQQITPRQLSILKSFIQVY